MRSDFAAQNSLFMLLAVYELPILLYYLVAARRDWTR